MLNCLVVDDEELNQRLLADYIGRVPKLSLVHVTSNAVDALDFLNSGNAVDIIFLDIQLPELSGIEMLSIIPNKFKIILVTAYSDYAVQAFEFGVNDYLLKPLKFDRFLKAVSRVITTNENIGSINDDDKNGNLKIKYNGEYISVPRNEIIYIQGFENYIKIFTEKRVFITQGPLKDFEHELRQDFVRVHRSYIISKKRVSRVKGGIVKLGEFEVPVGNSYQKVLNLALDKKF